MNVLENFKEYLKNKGLSDDVIKDIVDGMAEAKVYLTNQEKIDERYTKLKGQKELLDEQLKSANDTIETLKKSNSSNDELQKEVQKYKDANKELQKKYDEDVILVEKRMQFTNELNKAGAKYADLLVSSVDLNTLELKDGKLIGYENIVKELQEKYTDQFNSTGITEPNSNGYTYKPAGGQEPKLSGDIFSAMAEHSVRK